MTYAFDIPKLIYWVSFKDSFLGDMQPICLMLRIRKQFFKCHKNYSLYYYKNIFRWKENSIQLSKRTNLQGSKLDKINNHLIYNTWMGSKFAAFSNIISLHGEISYRRWCACTIYPQWAASLVSSFSIGDSCDGALDGYLFLLHDWCGTAANSVGRISNILNLLCKRTTSTSRVYRFITQRSIWIIRTQKWAQNNYNSTPSVLIYSETTKLISRLLRKVVGLI